MVFIVCAVYDVKAAGYMLPFFAVSESVGVRMFAAGVNDPDSGMVHKYPEDFQLHKIGTFNDETGCVAGFSPVSLGVGSQFKARDGAELTGDLFHE